MGFLKKNNFCPLGGPTQQRGLVGRSRVRKNFMFCIQICIPHKIPGILRKQTWVRNKISTPNHTQEKCTGALGAKPGLDLLNVLDLLVVVVVVSPGVYGHCITVATSCRPRPSGTAAVTRFPGRHAGHSLRTSRRLPHAWYNLCSLMLGKKG